MSNESAGAVANICMDALSMASQLGRLDLVTIILAAISILLVLSGIVAFFEVRSTAKKVAKQSAEEIAAPTAEAAANKYLQDQLPLILQEYQNFISGMVNENTANEIANAQENNEEQS